MNEQENLQQANEERPDLVLDRTYLWNVAHRQSYWHTGPQSTFSSHKEAVCEVIGNILSIIETACGSGQVKMAQIIRGAADAIDGRYEPEMILLTAAGWARALLEALQDKSLSLPPDQSREFTRLIDLCSSFTPPARVRLSARWLYWYNHSDRPLTRRRPREPLQY